VVVYDNFNFKDTKRDELLGHSATMRAMTTAAVVICPELPTSGLTQSMHNPILPLNMHDIFGSPAISGDNIGVEISRSLISDEIKRIHPSSVKRVFTESDRYPKMPNIQVLPSRKTKYWQLGAIYEDEGTIQGTYRVHESIFLDQLGLRSPDTPDLSGVDDFSTRLWLIHGDQLTTHHIRSIKAEQTRARRPFDRRDWHIGIPAWFHIEMNLINTIVRTHWAPDVGREEAHHCLSFDIGLWGRSYKSRENAKYHQMQPLVSQSFDSRVVALFYAALQSRGYFTNHHNSLNSAEEIDEVICSLTPDEFLKLVEEVRLRAFTLDAWQGKGPDKKEHNDTEFRTMCRMLQEIELFLTVHHATKHADIGMLRRLVDPLIVYFFGASQHNYGREMLYYRWLLSPVNTPELQHAILASGIVNWQGSHSSNKAIDRGQEHLNMSIATSFRSYKNSTHDLDIIFDRVCLTNTWVAALRTILEDTFGENMPGTHTTASVESDIFLLARTLFRGDLAAPRTFEQLDEFSREFFDSQDILKKGMDVIEEKVIAFNQQRIHYRGITAVPDNQLRTNFIDDDEYLDEVDIGAESDLELEG
jgi:hypothetical protein